MTLPMKGAIAAAMTVAIGGNGIWHFVAHTIPSWTPLASLGEESKIYKDKYAEDYLKYFVNADNSKEWWKWSYKKKYKVDSPNLKKGKFSDIKIPLSLIDAPTVASLEKVCKEAYESDATKVKASKADSIENDEFLESNIWRYCSPFSKKPSTVEEKKEGDKYKQGQIQYLGSTKQGQLISTADENNKDFWIMRHLEFFGTDGKAGTGAQATANGFFRDFYEKNNVRSHKTIKNICEDAYSRLAGTTEKEPKEIEVIKYCSLKGKEG